MNFYFKIILPLWLFVFLPSCSSYDDINSNLEVENNTPDFEIVKIPSTKLRTLGRTNVVEDEYAIKFKDNSAYNRVLADLELMPHEEREKWMNNLEDFSSMYKTYEEAMAEAEEYCDRAGGYEEFKEKYPSLYFPENNEDFGAYVPYENELLAICANENGRLIVGEEIIDLEKIDNYEQLIASGRGMVEEQEVLTDGDTLTDLNSDLLQGRSINSRAQNPYIPTMEQLMARSRINVIDIVPGSYWFEKKQLGGKFSTGWMQHGKRKIKIDLSRETRTNYFLAVLPGGFRLEWHLEVSFRKKGFLGKWYNYKSRTDTRCDITYYGEHFGGSAGGQKFRLIEHGTSSHDMWVDATVYRYIRSGKNQSGNWPNLYDKSSPSSGNKVYGVNCLYLLPAFSADITVDYQGISKTLTTRFWGISIFGKTPYQMDKLGWRGPI